VSSTDDETWQGQGLVEPQRQAAADRRLLAGVVVLGWQAWHKYQANQSQGASRCIRQLLETSLTPTAKPDASKVAELAGKLKSEFGGSAYAQYGSLFVAKVAVDTGKLDDAAAELKAVLDKPADATLGEIARQRLAACWRPRTRPTRPSSCSTAMPTKPSWPAAKSSRVTCWCSWVVPTTRTALTKKPRRRCPMTRRSVAYK
jgi:hypothetical protein